MLHNSTVASIRCRIDVISPRKGISPPLCAGLLFSSAHHAICAGQVIGRGGRSLDVIVPAVVGVIQTGYERDHNSDAGIEGFERLRADLPWIDFRYYDEHSANEFCRRVDGMGFSAIVYASNSLWNPAIFESSLAAASSITRAAGNGMGVVILQQFLPRGSSRSCDFLPLAHQVAYSGVAGEISSVNVDRRALKVDSEQRITLGIDQFGDRSPMLWCEIKLLFPREWRPITSVRVGDRDVDVLFRSRTPRGQMIVSALPLDWLADSSLLAHAVSRAVRGRGTLYLHPADENTTEDAAVQVALGRAVLNGGFLTRRAISDPALVKSNLPPFRHFSHFIISRAWTWSDLGSLAGQDTRTRLENGGSITAHARILNAREDPAAQHPLLVTVGGRPSYLAIADRFGRWFEANRTEFRQAQTAPVRALATVVNSIMAITADPDAVPQVMNISQVRSLLDPYIMTRRGNLDNVDGHVLPTAAIAATMELLGYAKDEVAPLRAWIEKGEYTSSAASLRQAVLWLPGLCLALPTTPGTEIDKIYSALLRARAEGHDAGSIEFLCNILQDSRQSLSLRAIVAEALTEQCDYLTLAKVASSARTLQGDLDSLLTAEHPPLEAVCLITAALIRIHAASGLTCGVSVLDHDAGRTPDANTSDLRRELELVHQQVDAVESRMTHAQKFARRVVGTMMVAALLAALGILSLLIATLSLSFQSGLELFLPSFAALTVALTYVGIHASVLNCEPHWMSAMRDFLSRR
jgi:hypothetical protein